MPIFKHDEIQFQFETLGEGRPIVICHGLTGDRNRGKDLLGELPGHRLVVADSRAHGDTEPVGPESKICFSQFAADLHALLEHLKIDQAIVGGISMGAAISTRFAIDFPNQVRGLILIRPAWADAVSPENLQLCPLIVQLFEQHGPEQWQQAYDAHPLVLDLKQQDPLIVDSMRKQFDSSRDIDRRIRLVRMPGDCPIRNWQEIESLDIPALVMGNDNDLAHPIAMAREWATRLPNARFEQIPSKSESLERHTQAARRHVASFLEVL